MIQSTDSSGVSDLRPLPGEDRIASAVGGAWESLMTAFLDTRLEPGPVLWNFVDVFYQQTAGIQRELDDNAGRLSRLQNGRDGFEDCSVELERLAAQKRKLIDEHGVFKSALDFAIGRYKAQTGLDWRPCVGSQETM